MEVARKVSNTNLQMNTGNKTDNANYPVAVTGGTNFSGNSNDLSAKIPIDVHVTSNIGDLRVFSEDRNLYEILLNKEAAPKRKEMNGHALIGGAIGTLIPALIFYSAKLKKGQVNIKIMEGLKDVVNPEICKEFNYSNAKKQIEKITEKSAPEIKAELGKVFKKLDNLEPKEALSKLLEEAGLEHNLKKLNKEDFYFGKGKKLYIENTFEEAEKLFTKDGKKRGFWSYFAKTDELSLKEVLLIGVGSIAGGYLGGVAKDEGEINKKKTKEATYQLINNIICPTILTEQLITRSGLNIKPPKDTVKGMNAVKRYAKSAAAIIVGVGVGINVGTRIANFVNKQYFKDEKYERKIGLFDVFIHVDDVPLALNFMQIPFMDKLLLFCSGLCGYEAGKKE